MIAAAEGLYSTKHTVVNTEEKLTWPENEALSDCTHAFACDAKPAPSDALT